MMLMVMMMMIMMIMMMMIMIMIMIMMMMIMMMIMMIMIMMVVMVMMVVVMMIKIFYYILSGVKSVAVIVTDGHSKGGIDSMITKTRSIQNRGIELFVIGLGPATNTKELRVLASEPKGQHLIMAQQHEPVKHLVDKVVRQICKPRMYF